MALGEQIKLTTLNKRGTATCINVSNRLAQRLGWNKGDALRLDVVRGSLVVSKVVLPAAPDVVSIADSAQVANEVQPVTDNK